MRKFLFLLSLSAFFLFFTAFGEECGIKPESSRLSCGETLYFAVTGYDEPHFTLFCGDELLLEGSLPADQRCAYTPSEPGTYFLQVEEAGKNTSRISFEVSTALKCRIAADASDLRLGENLILTAEASGGDGPYTYDFSIIDARSRTGGQSGPDPVFSYTADQTGEKRILLRVTDRQGLTAEDGICLTVTEGAGLSAEGDFSPVPCCGALRRYRVFSSGFWSVAEADDFLRFSPSCGTNGDFLTVFVPPETENARYGKITLQCGVHAFPLPIVQLPVGDDEEEILFASDPQPLLIDGASAAVWENAAGEKTFSVQSPLPWSWKCEDSRVSCRQSGDSLVAALSGDFSAGSAALIVLSDGITKASLLVLPSAREEAGVLSAEGPKTFFWGQEISVTLKTDRVTDSVSVTEEHGSEHLFDLKSGTRDKENPLLWHVSLPVSGSGPKRLLIRAGREGAYGSGVIRSVTVQPPEKKLLSDAALFEHFGEASSVTFTATSSVKTVTLVYENARDSVRAAEAFIDFCIDASNAGYAAQWTVPVPPEKGIPIAVRCGGGEIPVEVSVPSAPEAFYSQMNGHWKDVPYRNSNLEVSGCAIFTLSNALHRLGITGAETEPEALASAYAFCLVDGGTLNSTLIGNAGKQFGYKTRYHLLTDREEVASFFGRGAVFSFSVVNGHIALADGLSEDGTMIHVVDSALSATFSRIKNASVYVTADGAYRRAEGPEDLEGTVFYIESGAFSGGEYWLETKYVLKRGLRLILPVN